MRLFFVLYLVINNSNMKKILSSVFFLMLIVFACTTPSENNKLNTEPSIVIHGGAGYIVKDNLTIDQINLYESSLQQVLENGYVLLDQGVSAVEVVRLTIQYLENDSLFNAGKGSVLNAMGLVENDASIMDGSNLQAGAVASVSNVKNPIALAKFVMDSTKHVMLSGKGASIFADKMSVERVDQSYYMTAKRRKQKDEILKANKKYGTVGCVVRDKHGNIAAGTSTGGMHKKKWGRIGDSPIIGAGTYADNRYGGVSCTGHGEYFIRNAVAYDLIARIKYAGQTMEFAARDILHEVLEIQKGKGGLIGIDSSGEIVMDFNTPGMFRGFKKGSEKSEVFLFGKLKENRKK